MEPHTPYRPDVTDRAETLPLALVVETAVARLAVLQRWLRDHDCGCVEREAEAATDVDVIAEALGEMQQQLLQALAAPVDPAEVR